MALNGSQWLLTSLLPLYLKSLLPRKKIAYNAIQAHLHTSNKTFDNSKLDISITKKVPLGVYQIIALAEDVFCSCFSVLKKRNFASFHLRLGWVRASLANEERTYT